MRTKVAEGTKVISFVFEASESEYGVANEEGRERGRLYNRGG